MDENSSGRPQQHEQRNRAVMASKWFRLTRHDVRWIVYAWNYVYLGFLGLAVLLTLGIALFDGIRSLVMDLM